MESFEECASRELYEELNLKIDPNDIKYLTTLNVRKMEENFHFVNLFTVTRISADQ
jgi:ADP-ribose pyrophosphatase YjhB (NUDIX family)